MPPPTDRRLRAAKGWGGNETVNNDQRFSRRPRGNCHRPDVATSPASPMRIYRGLEGATMRLSFEWDEGKAGESYRKHKVSFEEGITVFNDPFSLTIGDPDHSADEQR